MIPNFDENWRLNNCFDICVQPDIYRYNCLAYFYFVRSPILPLISELFPIKKLEIWSTSLWVKNRSVISYIFICQADHYTSLRLSIKNHNDCHSIFVLRLSCNFDHTVVNVGHNNAHRYGENYFLHGCHKGMHNEYWLVSRFYGICAQTTGWLSWNCMVNAFCIDDSVCGESTAHMWIISQTINSAELCCLITAFCIVGGDLMLDLRFPYFWPSVQCLHWK